MTSAMTDAATLDTPPSAPPSDSPRATPAAVAAAKRRATDVSSGFETAMTEAQERAIRQIAEHLHRLNYAVMAAVESGVSVEMIRSSRHHGESGTWGDMMIPLVVKR